MPSNLELQRKVADLRKAAMFLNEAERSFFAQKAKTKFLVNSNKCSKFFHGLVKWNTKRNLISDLCREDGSVTTSQDQVAEEFIRFYERLLGTSAICDLVDYAILRSGPLISQVQASSLSRDVSSQEIKEARFSIGEEKSPGSDRYTSFFFKKAWPMLGDQFCDAM